MNIAHWRLRAQQVAARGERQPADVVRWLGAVQAQDYAGALWAIGLRAPGASEADVTRAIEARAIVRTWPMRGTLHFVAAADVRWLLALLAPRVIAGSQGRARQLELDEAAFARARQLVTAALTGGHQLTRPELYALLERGGISPVGQRGIHILGRLAQEGLICLGPHRGKQPTFVLLDEWVPPARPLARDEALAELARRYFTSHGPATLPDLMWWSGLTTAEARAAVAAAAPHLHRETVDGREYWMAAGLAPNDEDPLTVHLLPGFDELLLGYRDRGAVLDRQHANHVVPGGNGMFLPTIALGGRVVGTWKRTLKARSVAIAPRPFVSLPPAAGPALAAAAARYGTFLGRPATLIEAPAGQAAS